ncbi:MAG: hypothetical protein HN952_00130 [Candidatus Cloacimonetes bacterium]|jgi:hypothetical protein|nr:hypothetical protein [Candidatus Cloacimonadota bacterium]MBT6993340.1 hypothetical protein [Candidatus Cloacimonadota bacterium]
MKKTILIIAVILFVVGLSATDFKHSLGFAGGMISGSGFAYRQMNDNYGFQVTFGITMSDEDYFGSVGFEYIKPLHTGNRTKFYVLTGVSSYFSYYEDDYYYYDDDVSKTQEFDVIFNTGLGIGIEWQILPNNPNFKFSFDWPIVLSFDEDKFNIFMYIPQGGIHYYF